MNRVAMGTCLCACLAGEALVAQTGQQVVPIPYESNRVKSSPSVAAIYPSRSATLLPASLSTSSASPVEYRVEQHNMAPYVGATALPQQVYRPVTPVFRNQIYLGRGIIGQPKAYVSGQPLRNFFRWFFP